MEWRAGVKMGAGLKCMNGSEGGWLEQAELETAGLKERTGLKVG